MKKFNSTFFKFIFIGIINTLVGTSIMFVSYNVLHLGYWLSSFLNYSLTSVLSFFLNKNFTFNSKGDTTKKAIRFIFNILFCYLIAYGVAKPFTKSLLYSQTIHFQDNIAMIVGMIFFVILNYLGQKLFVFNR
ncbi:MAG: GtrA family protein [Lagierella massiliensis]|nr:GtrA family protein [Lagierella massiliensis]